MVVLKRNGVKTRDPLISQALLRLYFLDSTSVFPVVSPVMLLGISPYGLSLDDYVGAAVAIEETGFESMWVPDHFVVPAKIDSPFPYSPDGDSGMRPHTPMFDPWVLLSF